MKNIKIFLLSLASSFGAMAADIDVTPGQLESLLGNIGTDTTLKLKGSIDARDLAALENLSNSVESLDLSEVKIEALSTPNRKYFGRTLFSQGEIPAYTFFKSGVNTLVLPQDVTTIGAGAFAGSDITEIVIPEGVTSIGDYAFYGCQSLKGVTLPSSVKTIGKGAFGNCNSLTELDLAKTGLTYLPERVCAGSLNLERLTLPQVEKIGREAFSHTAIKELDLSGVKEFEEYALSSMPFLEKLAINPDADISAGLLMDDTSLYSLTGVPEMVPDYFAANCGDLASTAINNSGTLGKYSFANTLAPEELILPSFLTRIDRGAFSGLQNIKKIDVTALEDRMPSVDEFSFEGLSQPDIVLWVDDAAFSMWESDPVWGLFQVMSQSQTGVDEIPAEAENAAISIACRNNTLTVESASVINDVRIYTADGRVAYIATPGQNSVAIDTASLPSGIVIVAVADEDGNSKTASLLLR